MLVVQPTSLRFEAADAGISSNEHLLERISATENRITRLAERLERSLDLVLRQAQNSNEDRSLLQVLVEVLAEDGVINRERLEQLWNKECQKGTPAQVRKKSKKRSVDKQRVSPRKKRSPKGTRS